MDDNTKEVLILLITTCSTIGVAWIRMRGHRNGNSTAPQPPVQQAPPPPGV